MISPLASGWFPTASAPLPAAKPWPIPAPIPVITASPAPIAEPAPLLPLKFLLTFQELYELIKQMLYTLYQTPLSS